MNFAGNKLTVIVPIANPAKINSPKDLANPGVKIIAAGDAVPITKYANLLVANLAKQPGYPANFDAAYHANIVSKEDNVKAVVAKLELGEGDAAIVYVTDAKASTKVASVDVPPDANVPATYAGVVIKASANQTAAERLHDLAGRTRRPGDPERVRFRAAILSGSGSGSAAPSVEDSLLEDQRAPSSPRVGDGADRASGHDRGMPTRRQDHRAWDGARDKGPILRAMGFELESQTKIVIGRLAAPTSPDRAWWWQSSTTRDGADVTIGGFTSTENDAILQAAASTIDLHAAVCPRPRPVSTNGSHPDAAELIWSAPSPPTTKDESPATDPETPRSEASTAGKG